MRNQTAVFSCVVIFIFSLCSLPILADSTPQEITIKATEGRGSAVTSLGRIQKGQTIQFEYVRGEWTAWPGDPAGSPDDVPPKNKNVLPLSICEKTGASVRKLADVPRGTKGKPFSFLAPHDIENLVLNMDDRTPANNLGQVTYRISIGLLPVHDEGVANAPRPDDKAAAPVVSRTANPRPSAPRPRPPALQPPAPQSSAPQPRPPAPQPPAPQSPPAQPSATPPQDSAAKGEDQTPPALTTAPVDVQLKYSAHEVEILESFRRSRLSSLNQQRDAAKVELDKMKMNSPERRQGAAVVRDITSSRDIYVKADNSALLVFLLGEYVAIHYEEDRFHQSGESKLRASQQYWKDGDPNKGAWQAEAASRDLNETKKAMTKRMWMEGLIQRLERQHVAAAAQWMMEKGYVDITCRQYAEQLITGTE